jgi:alpha-1,6-mannosyltransferase
MRSVLIVAAAVLTLVAAEWARRGDMTRHTNQHLILFGVAFGAYLAGLLASRGLTRRGLLLCLGLALAWRIALVAGPPMLSDDIYRYVWEGRIQAHAGNPYDWRDRPQAERFAPLRDQVWELMNQKNYTALYPPLWQLTARAVVALNDSVTTMKGFVVACELAGWFVLARLLARRGQPRERLLIAAWSPLALVEIAGSGHNDSLALLLFLLGLLAIEARRPALSALAVTLAFMAKLVPGAMAVPWARRFRWLHLPIGVAVVALLVWPYAGAGAGLLRTAHSFGDHFRFNQTLFALFEALAGRNGAQLLSGLALFLAALWLARRPLDPAASALAMGAACLLCLPDVLPWYALWLLPLATLVPAPGALAFTGTVALSYTVYPGWLAGGAWQVAWPVRVLEYGVPLAIQAWALWPWRRRGLPPAVE